MADAPRDIERLIELMARLPGLGPRSARRAVLHMLRKREAVMAPLAQSLAQVALSARDCSLCGNIGTNDPCDICADPRRATGEICVVETVADLWAMERGRAFKGRYHVLGGTLSALDAIGPDELRIPRLVARVAEEQVSRGHSRIECDGRRGDHGPLHRRRPRPDGRRHKLARPGRADRRRAGLSGRRNHRSGAEGAKTLLIGNNPSY